MMLHLSEKVGFSRVLCVSTQVEKAPTVVKEGLPKAEAEELQKKLEAGANA
jgi:hypothetical protein